MLKTLLSLLPKENQQNIAYYSTRIALIDSLKSFALLHNSHLFELNELSLQRKNLPNEHFEAMIIDEADELFCDERTILLLKNGLQKNRHLIILSSSLNNYDLEEKLEPYGFSNFNTISEDSININLAKKWFSFAQ